MKITVKKANQDEILALRNLLHEAQKKFAASSAELVRLENHQQKLEKEITALEAAGDSESDAAAAKLATKRIQLEQVSKKINEVNSQPAAVTAHEIGAGEALLRKFATAAVAAIAPSLEAYGGAIAVKIRPFYLNDATAMHAAYMTPACAFLSQTYSRRFGDYGFTMGVLGEAIARADEILSGELAWSWDAKMGSSPAVTAKV